MAQSKNPKLKSYVAKRNFKSSPEPSDVESTGKKTNQSAAPEPSVFVIHKHAATRLHYDVRLECEGTLRSWAVPKGPSTDPLENRLAVRVEDHPLAYRDFEGVIPKGNYGAGTMMIWDEGNYTLYETLPGETHDQTFQRQYRKGSLKLEFHGQKLQGRFTLVKIKKSAGDDWLLIKKRDQFASSGDITLQDQSARSGLSLDEITTTLDKFKRRTPAKKPSSMQGSAATKPKVSSAIKKLLHQAPKLAIPANWRAKGPKKNSANQTLTTNQGDLLIQPVPQGMLATARILASQVEIRTTAGLNLTPRCNAITTALQSFPEDTIFMGVVHMDRSQSVFYICDLLWFDGHQTATLPLQQRWHILSQLNFENPVHLLPTHNSTEDGSNKEKVNVKTTGHIWVRQWSAPFSFNAAHDVWLEAPGRGQVDTSTPRTHLTNPDKIFWPEEGFTKRDLYEYYKAVAPILIPHLLNRPQSLNRFPNGISGKSFFQKEVAGSVPGWMATTNVASYGGRKTVTYLLCQNIDTLLYMINMGCIELNAWLSRVPNFMNPDFTVIDIDPGTLSFAEVIKGAQIIRELLENIEADSFCKTSGSRGLHIYLATDGQAEFADCQAFAELVGMYLQKKLPDLTSTDRSPLVRRDKLYIDTLQNRKGQTMACVYSVRPKPGAPVSTPIKWNELTKRLDPTKFTIKTVPARIEKLGDLWQDLAKSPNDIRILNEKIRQLLDNIS